MMLAVELSRREGGGLFGNRCRGDWRRWLLMQGTEVSYEVSHDVEGTTAWWWWWWVVGDMLVRRAPHHTDRLHAYGVAS